MTNEEKQALIEHIQTQLDLLRNVTMRYADECEIVDIERDIKVQEIALAALTAQPVAWTDEQELRDVKNHGCGYLFTVDPVTPNADPRRIINLFTRAAPAINLSELVPKQINIRQAISALENHEYCDTPASGYKAGVKDTIAAILSKIEEAK